MDFEKVLSLRQAVRAYTDEPVSEEQLKAILNAAYRAPVGMHNFAGYHLTVITRPELLALMVDTARKVTGNCGWTQRRRMKIPASQFETI